MKPLFFHEATKRALKAQKMSQSELARQLNVSHSTIWEWLNESYPPMERFLEICDKLKLSPNELLGFNA